MSKALFLKTFKAVLPSLLGYAGGTIAILYPAYHAAFCAGF